MKELLSLSHWSNKNQDRGTALYTQQPRINRNEQEKEIRPEHSARESQLVTGREAEQYKSLYFFHFILRKSSGGIGCLS